MDNASAHERVQTQLDTMSLDIKLQFSRQEDVQNDMERLRGEQSEVYTLFTANDQKIVDNYLKNKALMDEEIALFKTRISSFDNDMSKMMNRLDEHNIIVDDNSKRVTTTQESITAVKKTCMELAAKTAR